ncbi:hypothetical protein BSNK01_29130 [Bacillaceae bacterium]
MQQVKELLRRFGVVIYTGDRLGDLLLMEDELKELYQQGMLEEEEFRSAMLQIRRERQKHV